MVRQAAIFDLDGCLADDSHRLHFLKGDNPDWDSYFAHCGSDKLIDITAQLYWGLADTYTLVISTGRPERTRTATALWLAENELAMHSHLWMRGNKDLRPNWQVKQDRLKALCKRCHYVVAFDDQPRVAEMYRANNVPCFLLFSPGYAELGLQYPTQKLPVTSL